MNEKFRTRLCERGVENFDFIVSERVQVNTTSRRLFRHNPVSRGINQPIRKSEFVQCMKV